MNFCNSKFKKEQKYFVVSSIFCVYLFTHCDVERYGNDVVENDHEWENIF